MVARNGAGAEINLIVNANDDNGGRNVLMDKAKKYPGHTHIAYDVDDIDAAVAAAAAHDVRPIGAITVIDKGPNAGGRVAYLRDPDGITIEFIQKPV